jgi:hypothetical protein
VIGAGKWSEVLNHHEHLARFSRFDLDRAYGYQWSEVLMFARISPGMGPARMTP